MNLYEFFMNVYFRPKKRLYRVDIVLKKRGLFRFVVTVILVPDCVGKVIIG
jgi:hypothetical protein